MTEVTLASLAMDFNVAKAEPARQQTDALRASARALEDQVKSTSQAVRDHAIAQGLSGTAAGRVEQSLRPVIAAYGQARDALGRFAQEDGKYRLSQDATAKMLLQNANAATAYARQQEQAAKMVAKAEADAAREAQSAWKQSQAINAEIMRERVALARAAEREEAQAAKAAAQATATAERERAQAWRQSQQVQAEIMRERVALARAAEAEEARLTRQQEQAAATTASYAAKVAGLKAQLDPFAAVQLKLAQNTKLLDDAMAHGAITADQHATALSQVTRAALADVQAINGLHGANTIAGGSMKTLQQLSLNTGRQLTDMGVQISGGQSFGLILIQQLPQIIDGFQVAKQQGLGFKEALAGMAAEAAPFVAIAAPLAIIAGLLALGVKRNLDNQEAVRTFTGQLALNVDGLNYNAEALAKQSKELARYGISAKDASAGLSTFVDAGVDAAKLKDFSVAAKSLSEVSTAFKDVKSAQEAVSTAFTGGFDAVDKLDQKLNFLTVAQYEHIKAMFDAGKASDAQAEAFKAFADQVDQAADKARGPWQESVRELSGAWGDFTDALAKSDGVKTAVFGLEQLMNTVSAALRLAKSGGATASDAVPDFMRNRGIGYKVFNTLNPFAYLSDAAKRNEFNASAIAGVGDLGKSTGGVRGTDSQAEKAYQRVIDGLDLQLDQTKKVNDAERVRLAAERQVTDAISKGVTSEGRLAEIRRKAGDIEQAKIDKEKAASARSGASAANRALRLDDTTQDALDRAQKAELAAKQALTKNIETLAGYRREQVAAEAEAAKDNVDREVSAKKLNGAMAPSIKAAIDRTAALKTQAIDQQLLSDQIARQRAVEDTIAGYTDRQAQSQANLATSLEQAQAIENKAIADQQQRAAARREFDLFMDWADGKKTEAEVRQINEAASAADVGARAVKAQEDRLAIFQRDLGLADARLRNSVDLLQSEQGLARSSYEAAQIEKKIEQAQYDAQRDRLAKIIANTDIKGAEHDIAVADLATLEAIHKNHLKQLNQSENMVTAMTAAINAVDGMARAFKSGDIGGGISGLSKSLGSISGLLGSGSKLGGTLGSISSFLGPIGGLVSGVTSLFGGLFGGGGAKKRQREQEAAQRAAEEAQRVQTIADTGRQIEIDTLRASGNEIAAVALERKGELDALTKLDPALATSKQAYYDLVDAADKKAKADKLAADARGQDIQLMELAGNAAGALAARREDELAAMDETLRAKQKEIYAAQDAAKVAEKRASIQDEIDQLTLSSAELLSKTRAKERAEAVALDPALGDLIDKLFSLQDAATATAGAVEAAQQQLKIDDYLRGQTDKATQSAADAQAAYNTQMTAFADAATTAAHALDDTIKSLTAFADSLKTELGLGTTGGGLEQAKRAFNTAVATGNYDAIPELGKAYADAAKNGASSQTEYLRIVAQIRQASLNSATSAKSDAYQSSLDKLVMGALFQGSSTGDFSGLDEIRRLKAAGLPMAANGGSFTVGGNGGVDNNLLSINGVPAAAVNQGERVFIEPAGRRASNDNSELAALRQQVASLEARLGAALDKIADNTSSAAKTLRNVTPNGNALATEAAS